MKRHTQGKDQFFEKLPTEILGEIGNFMQLDEIHKLMLVNRQLFQKISSDGMYSKVYWKQIMIHCNAGEQKRVIYNPETISYHSNEHFLYRKYAKVSSNFRNELVLFKKEFSQDNPNFPFTTIDKMRSIDEKIKKHLEKDDHPGNGKICIIGNSTCGKTSLFWRLYTNDFQEIFWYCYEKPNLFYGNFSVSIWDLACKEDYDSLRTISYPDTGLILVCFSLIDRNSFDSIRNKWIPEMRYHLKDTPAILVGCKHDLREELLNSSNLQDKQSIISSEEAEEFARSFKFISYWENSSKTGFGMNSSLEILVNGCIYQPASTKSKKKCLIQ